MKVKDTDARRDKIEILLAARNGEKYIGQLLDSLLAQDYENWVVRACDDASSDRTYEILSGYKNRYPDRFMIERSEKGHGGAKENFFHLIKQSTCDYVMFCDHDDVWLPDKISVTYAGMKEAEEDMRDGRPHVPDYAEDLSLKEGAARSEGETCIPILVHTDLKVVSADLAVISDSFIRHSNLRKHFNFRDELILNSVTGCTVMINRPLVNLLCMQETYGNVIMHDWYAALIASAIGKVKFIDKSTILYRQHGGNEVGAKRYGLSLFAAKLRDGKMTGAVLSTMRQAEELSSVYARMLPEREKKLASGYAALADKGKIAKWAFYISKGVWKKGLPRKIGQLIFG